MNRGLRFPGLAAGLLLVASARSQIEIPTGIYEPASLTATVFQCTEGGNTSFTGQGAWSPTSQNGASFTALGSFEVHKFGLVCQLDITFTGTIDDAGAIDGNFNHDFDCDGGFSSFGDGTFEGTFLPTGLKIVADGGDTDIDDEMCFVHFTITWSSGGADGGPNAPAFPYACSARRLKAAAKSAASVAAGHAKDLKSALDFSQSGKLDTAVAKAVDAYGKVHAATATQPGSCAQSGAATVVTTALLDGVSSFRSDVTMNMTPGVDPADDALRASVLRAGGRLVARLLKAEAKYQKTFKFDKLTASQAVALDAFRKKVGLLIEQATIQGVQYTGPAADVLAGDLDQLAATLNAVITS